MIQNFKNKALEKLLTEGDAKGIPPELKRKIRVRIEAIDSATAIDDLRISGYNLHELKGARKGTWSIKVSANQRLTFKFKDNNAYDLDLEDYH